MAYFKIKGYNTWITQDEDIEDLIRIRRNAVPQLQCKVGCPWEIIAVSVEANIIIRPKLIVNLVVGGHNKDLIQVAGGAWIKNNRSGRVQTPFRLAPLVIQTQPRGRIDDLSGVLGVLKILIRILRIIRHHYGGALVLGDERVGSLILKTEESSIPHVDDREARCGIWKGGCS